MIIPAKPLPTSTTITKRMGGMCMRTDMLSTPDSLLTEQSVGFGEVTEGDKG
jgi:hypothetical protein